MARRLGRLQLAAILPLLLALAACSSLAGNDGNPYEMAQSALRAYQSGNDARAEALYLGLIRMDPNDPENLLRLGNLYARNGKPDRAAETYMQALLISPGDTRLWYNLGLVRQRQAEAAMIQVLQLTSNDDPRHQEVQAILNDCLRGADKSAPAQHSREK